MSPPSAHRVVARRVVLGALGLLVVVPASVSAAATSAQATSDASTSGPGAVQVDVDASSRVGTTIDQSLLGVDGPGPSSPVVDAAEAALGLHWVRTDVSFESSYDCARWDPTSLDGRVQRIEDEGAKPLLIVDYTPPCLVPLPGAPPPGNDSYEPPDVGTHQGTSDQVLWDGLVEQMAVHEIARGVCAFEVWNEPDGTFWYGGLPGYLHLYQDTATALEAATRQAKQAGTDPCPSVEIGGPALVFSDAAWIEPFLAFVAAEHLPLDFLSWHYYGDYPELGPVVDAGLLGTIPPSAPVPYWYNPALRAQTYALQVQQVRAEVAAFPMLHPRLWIDEWNVDAGADARMNGPYDAAFATAVLDAVQSAGLDRMTFFEVADAPPTTPPQEWGMLTDTGAPKPVYEAFLFWHRMARDVVGVSLSPPQNAADPIGRIGAVAARGPSGRVTVLVYDFLPYDPTGTDGAAGAGPGGHRVEVRLTGLGGGRHRWVRALVDGAHPIGSVVGHGRVRGGEATVAFPLAADGVTLLTFTTSS